MASSKEKVSTAAVQQIKQMVSEGDVVHGRSPLMTSDSHWSKLSLD